MCPPLKRKKKKHGGANVRKAIAKGKTVREPKGTGEGQIKGLPRGKRPRNQKRKNRIGGGVAKRHRVE